MGKFEFDNEDVLGVSGRNLDPRRLREECIIAHKVYDSCRGQECLTATEMGPARAAEDACIGDEHICEGEIIDPPSNAATVSIDHVRIKKIIVVSKEPSSFRNGFWDVDLKFVFEYKLTFREADGSKIGCIKANSIYNKMISLFGSYGTDLVVASDLYDYNGSGTLDADPFILVEAKAVGLSAELKYQRRINCGPEDLSPSANRVDVTIGLFFIVKLYRIVNLTVESRGFCIPDECEDLSPLNPCEYFDNLDFPMDIFAPPQKPEFYAGISGNISRNGNNGDCGCNS